MRIKKFNENEVQGPSGNLDAFNDISPDKLKQIIDELKTYTNLFNEKVEKMKKIESDLSKFKSNSKSKMDQIDDAYIEIQKVNKTISDDVNGKLDNIIKNLNDRLENGKSYIYGN